MDHSGCRRLLTNGQNRKKTPTPAQKEEKIEKIVMIATSRRAARPPYCEFLIEKFSSLYKLTKATAIVLRFTHNFIHKYKPHIVTTQEYMDISICKSELLLCNI